MRFLAGSPVIRRLTSFLVFLGLLGAGVPASFSAEQRSEGFALEDRHVQFLEDVDLIMTPIERETLAQVTNASGFDLFIDAFWKARDPTPGTERNEGREEHFRRLAYVRKRLDDDTPRDGVKTDRGRMYILLGEPIRIESYPANRQTTPMELWFYSSNGNRKLPPYFYLLFYRPFETGEYQLYVPGSQRPGNLVQGNLERQMDDKKAFEMLRDINPELAYASVSLDATKKGGSARTETSSFSLGVIAAVQRLPEDTVDTSYVRRFSPDGMVDVEPNFSFVEMDWISRAYVHEDGATYLHYALQLLPQNFGVGQRGERTYTNLLVAGTVTRPGKAAKPVADLKDTVEVDLSKSEMAAIQGRPFAYLSRQVLLPGRYELHLILKNNTSLQYGRTEEEFEIPDPATTKPMLTKPLLVTGATKEERRSDGMERPFQIGELRLEPKLRNEAHPEEKVGLYGQFLLGGSKLEPGWKAVLDFIRDGAVGHTETQELDAAPAGPSGTVHIFFDLAVSSVALGTYELRMRILDANGGVVATGAEAVVITRDLVPPPWQSARRRPGARTPDARLDRARQLRESDRAREAETLLSPVAAQLLYTEGLLQTQAWRACLEMVQIAKMLDKKQDAVAYLERALAGAQPTPELLNELGQLHVSMGNNAKAIDAWKRSLQLERDQPEIAEDLKKLTAGTVGAP